MSSPNKNDQEARRELSRRVSVSRCDFYADEVVALIPDFPQVVRDWAGTLDPALVRHVAHAEYACKHGEGLHWQHLVDHYDALMKEAP